MLWRPQATLDNGAAATSLAESACAPRAPPASASGIPGALHVERMVLCGSFAACSWPARLGDAGAELLRHRQALALGDHAQHVLHVRQARRGHADAQAAARSPAGQGQLAGRSTGRTARPCMQVSRDGQAVAGSAGLFGGSRRLRSKPSHGQLARPAKVSVAAGARALDTLEQAKMRRQVAEYFSMVRRRLCCASLVRLSTSFRISTL